MFGLDIELPYSYGNYLLEILNGIDIENLFWDICHEEILCNNKEYLFQNKYMDGESFKKIIGAEKYFIIFIDLKAYKTASKNYKNIEKFEDFIKSDCEIVILCTDSIYLEVYCKDAYMLKKIIDNCIVNKYKYSRVPFNLLKNRSLVAW